MSAERPIDVTAKRARARFSSPEEGDDVLVAGKRHRLGVVGCGALTGPPPGKVRLDRRQRHEVLDDHVLGGDGDVHLLLNEVDERHHAQRVEQSTAEQVLVGVDDQFALVEEVVGDVAGESFLHVRSWFVGFVRRRASSRRSILPVVVRGMASRMSTRSGIAYRGSDAAR